MAKIFVFIVLVGSAVVLIFLYQTNISDLTSAHRSTHERYFRASEPIRFGPYHSLLDMNKTGNLPDVYLDDKAKKPSRFNQSCARFPGIFDLKFKNDHWQVQKTSKGSLYLFNAYLDKRQGTSVRILATYNQPPRQFQFYCQFWYPDSSRPVIVQTRTSLWLFRMGWGAEMGSYLHPYLISCEVKSLRGKLPISVSLVEGQCDSATNNLKIFGSKRAEKKNFVVCVKGLSFPYQDMTTRLAEWIEYLNILGGCQYRWYSLYTSSFRCRKDQLLRVQGPPQHQEVVGVLRRERTNRSDSVDPRGRLLQPPLPPDPVPAQENRPEAPPRGHSLQRLPLQAPPRV
jgi:hypothetical protein